MTADPADARTTPRALQVPVVLLLGALAVYFAASFGYALGPGMPAWAKWGNWQMFSVAGHSNSALDAELELDGEWVPVDLETLFPSRFESGPRYRQLRNRPGIGMQVLADSACDRDPRQPTAIRMYDVHWPIVPGEDPYLRKKARRKKILEWRCSKHAPRPGGVVW
jgi:hypothetical protein